jgi:hypothetical protein
VGIAGQAADGVTVVDGVREPLVDPGDQVVAEGAEAGRVLLLVLDRGLHRHRERDHSGGVQGARPDVTLLTAAVQQRGAGHVAAEQQRADADRTAELVAGQGQCRRAAGGEVDRYGTHGLDRVGVERDARPGGDRGQFGDRLDRADLVVRPLDADHGGIVVLGEQGGQRRGGHPAGRVDREPADRGALVGTQPVDRVQYRVVLDGRRHHAP